MRKHLPLLAILCLPFMGMANTPYPQFEQELEKLKAYFQIPGLAVLVKEGEQIIYENYLGYADEKTKKPIDAKTLFPIASITKSFSAVIMLQLAEEGKVKLENPVVKYLKKSKLPKEIQVIHLLSHTSEGTPGTAFNYSPRFGILTQIIEKVEKKSFAEVVKERILEPFGLKETIPGYPVEGYEALEARIASPYQFEGKNAPGYIPEGISTSSGLISSVRDLAHFDDALQLDQLLKPNSKQQMFTPLKDPKGNPLPYALGIFVQEFEGQKMIWGYGQEDCYSSLFLKVPEKDLTFILLANNNLASDPARLINGNVLRSKFALAFLRNFIFEAKDGSELPAPSVANTDTWSGIIDQHPIYREEFLAHTLAENFFGQGKKKRKKQSSKLLLGAYAKQPELFQQVDIPLLHNLTGISDAKNETWVTFTKQVIDSLMVQYPANPYVKYYAGEYYQTLDQEAQAIKVYESLVNQPNHQIFWYSMFAHYFIAEYYKKTKPAKAKPHYQKIIDTNWNIAGLVTKSQKAMKEL